MGRGGPGCGRRLCGGRRRDRIAEELLRQIRDPLELKCVEELKGEDDLLQFDLAVDAFEDARATGDCKIRFLVCQVRPLHRNVAVVTEIEAVYRLVSVSIALRHVLDQDTEPCCDPQPLLQVPMVELNR